MSCLVLTLYRSPKLKNGFLSEFGELLSKITVEFDSVLLCGDFNMHDDNPNDPFAKQFTDMLSTFQLTQHITGPTHSQGHTLDLVISKGLGVTTGFTRDVGISDHVCIFFNVALMTKFVPGLKSKLVKKRAICAETSNTFIMTLLSVAGHSPF